MNTGRSLVKDDGRTPSVAAPIAEEKIEKVVRSIQSLTDNASLDLALAIGKLVVTEILGGDAQSWRRGGSQNRSLRKLAEHKDLPISGSCLYRSIAIYELFQRLDGRRRWGRLAASHVRAVLGLPEPAQVQLLDAAHANKWSVKTLESECRKIRVNRQGRGRPSQPPVVQALRRMQNSIQRSEVAFQDPASIGALDDDARKLLRLELAELRRKIYDYEAALSNRLDS